MNGSTLLQNYFTGRNAAKPEFSIVLVKVMSEPAMQQEVLRLEQRALRVRATELAAEQVKTSSMHACMPS